MADWRKEAQSKLPENRREIPSPAWVFENGSGNVIPETETEALMMTPPGGHIPETHKAPTDDIYQMLEDEYGIDLDMTDDERDVMDAIHISGLSIREAASVLGMSKSTVQRISDSTMSRIRKRIANSFLEKEDWNG